MAAITEKAKKSVVIRELALKIVNGKRQKDFLGEINSIHKFVRDRIRYVKDVKRVETLQSPQKTLEYGQGDCDDKSMLAAALLESIGHEARFVAVGFGYGFTHVYVEALHGSKWIPLETTEPWPLGKKAPGIKQRLVKYVDN